MTTRRAHGVSLRWRVTLLVVLTSLALFTGGATLLYSDLIGRLSAAIDEELDVRLDDVEAGIDGRPTVLPGDDLYLRWQVIGPDGTVEEPEGSSPMLTGRELDRARRGRIMIERSVAGLGSSTRIAARPAVGSDGTRVVVAATSTHPLETARDRLQRTLVIVSPLVAAIVGAGFWILAGAVLRPVKQMALAAAAISASSAERRLPDVPGKDELAVLAQTLNSMLERIDEAVSHERAFIDDAAHELRTPLAVLRGELELAALDLRDQDAVAESLRGAMEETDRLVALTTDLLILARSDAGQLEPQGEQVVIGEVVAALVEHLPTHPSIKVEMVDASHGAMAFADPIWVRQMVTNLVSNAQRYASTAVQITISSSTESVDVSVADDGDGVAPDLSLSLFERFSRGSEARNRTGIASGFGLGLAITSTLADAQGATVRVANGEPLGGACFTIRFHAPPSEPPSAAG